MSTVYDTEAVILAAGITAVIVVALTVFAFQTKYDFTICGGFLTCVLVLFVLCGFLMIFLPFNKYVDIAMGAGGAFLVSVYLVFEQFYFA